jgi:PAS domain S-box-containing protein
MSELSGKKLSGQINVLEKEIKLLKEENERHKSFYNTLNVAVLTFSRNHIIDWNPQALILLKLSGPDLQNHTLAELSPEVQPNGQKSAKKAEEIFKQCIKRRKIIFEWSLRIKKRNPFRVEIILNCEKTSRNIVYHAIIQKIEQDKIASLNSKKKNREIKILSEKKFVEQKLELFKAIVQHLSDLVWIIDSNMIVKYESPSISRILGYEPGYSINKNGFEYIHPDDGERVLSEFEKVLNKTYEHKPIEIRLRHYDTHWVYVEILADNLIDHPGINGILITARDISERKTNEEKLKIYHNHLELLVQERTNKISQINTELLSMNQELKATNEELAEANEKLKTEIEKRHEAQISLEESENKFRSFIEQSNEGISVIDETGKFVEWNKAMELIFHVERNEVINTYAWEFDYRFLPEKRKTPEMFEELKTSVLDYFSELNYKKILTFEGFYQTMEFKHKYLTINVFPIITPKGKFVGRIVRDITGIRRAQDEINRQSEELKSINENLEEQKKQLEQTLNQLKKAQAQLVESEKMVSLGILTAGIAHEINNPVNYINTGLEGLKISLSDYMKVFKLYEQINQTNVINKLAQIEKHKKQIDFRDIQKSIDLLLKNMLTGVNRITEIVKSLRSFARTEDNELKETNIHEIVDSVLVMLHNQYKNNIEIIKNYGNLPQISCFPGRLSQVFMNIISNAIQAIPGKGTIQITTHYYAKVQSISISIKDSGKGISPDNIPNVFEPFFTTKEVGKGTGLGLSISYNIIQRHKGEIKVNSELNKGTEFIITLPVEPEI